MNNEYLNQRIRELDGKGDDYNIRGLEDTGKCIPYIGWFWREVDFENNIPIGKIVENDPSFIDVPTSFVGIMVNNKWDYPERLTSDEETEKIKNLLIEIVEESDFKVKKSKMQELFDYMQTLII